MTRLKDWGKCQPEIRGKALSLVPHLSSKNFLAEIEALRYFCYHTIRYTKDIRGIETLQTPVYTLRCRQGDCDDKCTLFASLAEAIGHETRFRAIGMTNPGEFCHVLPQVKIKLPGTRQPSWINVELTEDFPVGYFPAVRASMTT